MTPHCPQIEYIVDHDKLCLTPAQAQYVYEAVENNVPVTPLRVNVRSETAAVAGTKDTASMNPYAAALFTQCDAEFQEEPTTALANADLMWSLLGTEVQYKCPLEEFSFREMNDSPLYMEFGSDRTVDSDVDFSEDLYEEVYSTL